MKNFTKKYRNRNITFFLKSDGLRLGLGEFVVEMKQDPNIFTPSMDVYSQQPYMQKGNEKTTQERFIS